MTLIKHELKQGRNTLLIWSVAISLLLGICIMMFPEIKNTNVNDLFSSMGDFTAALGMDQVNFGTLIGFYVVECGMILNLGGAFFAALTAIAALSKEEKEHTAEFLLTHPVSRVRVITEKLMAVLLQILVMNVVIFGLALVAILISGEEIPWKELALVHTASLLMQIEVAGFCFGISAFLRGGSLGIGLGIAIILFFLSIIANMSEMAEFLKYITPFSYAEGADIAANGALDVGKILLGMGYTLVGIGAAYWKYCKKDIH